VLGFDVVVSLAKTKTHDTALLTLSLKNMMGCIVSGDKSRMHGFASGVGELAESVKVIHGNLLKLFEVIRPQISVIDGIYGMDGEGPVDGTPKSLGVVVASTDAVAADATAARLMGYNPKEIGYLLYAHEKGYGNLKEDEINIIGEAVENVKKKFKPHSTYEIQKNWRT